MMLFNDPRGDVSDASKTARLKGLLAASMGRGLLNAPVATKLPTAPGIVSPGNIDINNRPRVRNRDGSVSTVRTISIGTDGGEVVLPTIGPNGEDWSDEQAVAHYNSTGQNFGTFRGVGQATAYAKALHNQQERAMMQPPRGMFGSGLFASQSRFAGAAYPGAGQRLPVDAQQPVPIGANGGLITGNNGSPPSVAPSLHRNQDDARVGERQPWQPRGLRLVLGTLGDALSSIDGGPALFRQSVEQQRQSYLQGQELQARAAQQQADHAQRLEVLRLQQEAERNAPRFFASGRDQLRYDPATGQTSTIHDGQSDFEEYAASMGYQPGSEEYRRALSDYVLRSSGPTATENDLRIEGARQSNRVSLEGMRFGNRAALRATPTYGQLHPRPRAAPRPRANNEPTATNPQTGERVVLRNGRWVSAH